MNVTRYSRVGFWKEKWETSLGAHRVVLFLDQHHFRHHTTAWLVIGYVSFLGSVLYVTQAVVGVCGKDGGDTPIPLYFDIIY